MRLKDRVAVVTGGGGGLGEGISLCLAREGARVVVSDVKKELADGVADKVRESGGNALSVQTDVRYPDRCRNLIDTTLKEMGRLDILVCAAGVSGYSLRKDSDAPLTIENITEEMWNLTIDVNLKGVFLCNRAVIPHFKRQRKGKIVNISSVGGRMGNNLLAHYCASKAGVIVLTQGVAVELARYNINVNTVCPGIIWTPMWAEGVKVFSQGIPEYKGMEPEAIFEGMVKNRIALKRVQTPEDIGNAVVFLASEEAGEITGQALNVCGGMVFS